MPQAQVASMTSLILEPAPRAPIKLSGTRYVHPGIVPADAAAKIAESQQTQGAEPEPIE